MKAINFLLGVLMLCITTLSYGQNPYPPINRSTSLNGEVISQTVPAQEMLDNDSIVRLREAMANVDSMAPAFDPAEDSIASVDPNAVQAENSNLAPIIEAKVPRFSVEYNGMNPALFWAIVVVAGLLILWVALRILTNLIKSKTAEELGGAIKNLFQRVGKLQRKKDQLAVEEVITDIHKERVDRKDYTCRKMVPWYEKILVALKTNGVPMKDEKTTIRMVQSVVEGKRFWTINWNLIMASIIGILFVGVLGLYAFKQPAKVIINNEIPVSITPTVTAVVSPEPGGEVIIDHQSTDGTPPHSKVTTVVFDVPGENEDGYKPITPDWTLPNNPDGWRVAVTWTGNPVWYPVADKYDQFIDMRAGKNTDIGDYNPEKANFSFQSLDGKPAQVTLQYWSKVGV